MAKVDYYSFSVSKPFRCNGESYRTLSEAKAAYLQHKMKGDIVGCQICGCTTKEDGIFLTFTPWYEDIKEFGKTQLTNIGKAVKNGKYIIA